MKCDWCGRKAVRFVKICNGEENSFSLLEKLCSPHREQVPEGEDISEDEYYAYKVMEESPDLIDFMAKTGMYK